MEEHIDEIYELIKNSVYADNNKMYTNTQFDTNIESNITSGGGTGGGTIYGLKSFVNSRLQYIKSNLDCGIENSIVKSDLNTMVFLPNPAKDLLVVQLPAKINDDLVAEIFSITGQFIKKIELTNQQGSQFNFQLDGIESGAYLLRLSDKKSSGMQRFIVI